MTSWNRRRLLAMAGGGVLGTAGCVSQLRQGNVVDNVVHERLEGYRSSATTLEFDAIHGPHYDCGPLPAWMEDADDRSGEQEAIIEEETERREHQRVIEHGACSFDPRQLVRIVEREGAPPAGTWYGFVLRTTEDWDRLFYDNFTEQEREFLDTTDPGQDSLLVFQTSFGTVSAFSFVFVGHVEDEDATYVEVDATTSYDDDPTAERTLIRVPDTTLAESLIVGQQIHHEQEGSTGHVIWENVDDAR